MGGTAIVSSPGSTGIINPATALWYPGSEVFSRVEENISKNVTENVDRLKGWFKIGSSLVEKPLDKPQYTLGQRDGESIVLGFWKPRNYSGIRIGQGKGGKTFVVYVYREDLTIDGLMTFREAEAAAAAIKDLDGYSGIAYKNEKYFYKTLSGKKYESRWTVLPRVVLNGINFYSEKKVWEWNLYDHRENEALIGTLNADTVSGNSSLYGSMTSMPRLSKFLRIAIDFSDGRMVMVNTVKSPLNFRLGRFEECILQ